MNDLTNQSIKGYTLLERIGAGGFGAVYRAYQPVVTREVAIKVILPEYANQPDFIRRFETEAQLIARLEHPYIVPLFDYWREPDGAYLVMRFLRGGSLRALLDAGPLDLPAAAQLVDQIAGALSAAHRHGIVHRDIKPANILLDDDGNGYLADFGIAKVISGADDEGDEGISGSLAYASPEQIRSQSVTPQSDLYSLGILLYELLTGTHPFPGASSSELITKHLETPLPRVTDVRPDLPDAVDGVLRRATEKDLAARYSDALSLAADFRKALLGAGPETAVTEIDFSTLVNPYKGLRAFQEADAADFFGRETLIDRFITRLSEDTPYARFLGVVGPSGSGKSSAVSAGLLPALRQGRLPGSERWFIVEMTPGSQPAQSLAAALRSVALRPLAQPLEQLQSDPRGLSWVVDRVLADSAGELLLVIDQFEEIFTLVESEAERTQFLDLLWMAVTNPESRLRVIATLRADFVDQPLEYIEFGELLRQRMEFVLPLSPGEIEQAITGPARRAGLEVDANLLAAIVADVREEPGALPLLQYALTEVFERREGRFLTLYGYQQSGGVLGALARRAEEVYSGLEPAQQASARQVFLRLVTLGEGTEDTRRRALRSELNAIGDVEAALDAFGRYRLMTFDREPDSREPTVEVAHEALLRQWTRLREWLDNGRADVRLQRLLATSADEWLKAGKDAGFLLSGSRLAQYTEWAAETDMALTPQERDYLKASAAEHERLSAAERVRKQEEARTARRAQNFGRAAAVLAVVGVLAVIATILAGSQAAAALTQVGQANTAVATAQTQVAVVGQTLTPIPGTLTPVALTLAAGQSRLATANAAQGMAVRDAATAQANSAQANRLADNAQTQAAIIAATLTPIPPTLTAVAQQIEAGQNRIESLGLAASANALLQQSDANVESAALLSIRSLRVAYSPEADSDLAQALGRLYSRQIFLGDTDAIYSAAFSPDGRYVLTGSRDNSARLWDAGSGQELRQFIGNTNAIFSVAFSPDGRYVLTGGADNTVRWWDTSSGQQIREYRGHTDSVESVTFSPDGRYVLTGSDDHSARLLDAATGQEVRQFAGHTGAVNSVAFSPDGRYALTGSSDDTARLWDVGTGEQVRQFSGHSSVIHAVAFSPDGRYALTGSSDNTARLWDVGTGAEVRRFTGHTRSVYAVAFSPDGRYALISGGDQTALLWDVSTGAEVRRFTGHTGIVWSVAFSSDGRYALTGSDDLTARLWDAGDTQPRQFTGHTDDVTSAVFSPDGRYVLTGSADFTARLWDASSGVQLRQFTGHTGSILSVAFSPDGRYALTGSADDTARLWDVNSGAELRRFTGHTDTVWAVAFSPDGRYALTSSSDNTARLWDASSGAEVRRFTVPNHRVFSAAFSPDGRLVVTGSDDNIARLWDASTGEQLRRFEGHTDSVDSVAFSPDGRYVLTGSSDNTARLWDASTGAEVRRFTGPTDLVNSAAFSPDGRYALTSSFDHTARLWDVSSGVELRRLIGHTGPVYGVAFSPDGHFIVTASGDRTARLWDTDYHDFMTYACSRVFRDLTTAERTQYQIGDPSPTCPVFGGWASQTNTAPLAANPASAATLIATPTPSLTPTPTATPRGGETAQMGSNNGEIKIGGGQIWSYLGQANEVLTIRVSAARPVNQAHDRTGLLDTRVILRSPDGTVLAENDDIDQGVLTDSLIDAVSLPVTGVYTIEVRSFSDRTGGVYTLVIESSLAETPTPTPG